MKFSLGDKRNDYLFIHATTSSIRLEHFFLLLFILYGCVWSVK